MLVQEAVDENELPPEEPSAEPAPDIDLGGGSAGGTGPAIGPGGRGGSGRIGGVGRRGSASRYGWYAAKVQTSIATALRSHASIRNATFSVQVRIWPDRNGRITRSQLVGGSGVPAVDEAIRNQVLLGLQLPDPPPADMPTPIVLRVTARKP